MKIELLVIGKTDAPYLREGISLYEERLKHYISYSKKEIPDIRNASVLSRKQIKEREGEQILKSLKEGDHLVLLDERGESGNSEEFASRIEKLRVSGVKRVLFVVGGAYGFSDAVYSRS
ncbi:MAG: 23S rRNA (pseudouridine(1915)-N(3))-methyltransferase RlmH, partial [Bacteroidales bacterium]|nr:23S rRNA (pseudouridine(1915)-N(3))-methyltransferase RlmH [Bacteroidales bacterium]